MAKERKTVFSLVLVLGLLALAGYLFYLLRPPEAQSKAPPGLSVQVATTSAYHLESNLAEAIFGFATSTNCSARIITTKAVAITLSFNDGATSSPTYGLLQAASTTASYDADTYGCGRMTAYSMDTGGAATILTVVEAR